MRSLSLLSLAFLLAVVTASTAAARPQSPGEPPQLFAVDDDAPAKLARPLLEESSEELPILVNPAAVAANPPVFQLELPAHGPLEARRTSFVKHRPDWSNWSGELYEPGGVEPVGSIHIGFHGDRITALLSLDTGDWYRIVGGREEGQRLARLDSGLSLPPCGLDGLGEEGGHDHGGHDRVPTPFRRFWTRAQAESGAGEKILSCSANATIDLLVVYPSRGTGTRRGYFDANGPDLDDLEDFVEDSVARANQIFDNNGINAEYRLVGTVPLLDQVNLVPASPALPGIQGSLNWMNAQPAELANLRTAFGADVVAMFIPWNWIGDSGNVDRACAAANQPRGDGQTHAGGPVIPQALNKRAFSVNRDTCGLDDLTLAHEIGHNYGMSHETNYSSLLFPWAKGHNFTDHNGFARATVMGCNCTLPINQCVAGTSAVCNRISFFSDPDKTYNNVAPPTGVPIGLRVGGNDLAHNARVGCDQVTAYANFLAPSSNPAPNPSFTVSCAGLQCHFNAAATTDNQAIPNNSMYWDFGNGNTTLADSSVTYVYPSAGTYTVRLVVKDSGGKTAVTSRTAQPWVPVYDGYVEVLNCSQISGWAWDSTHGNDPITVNIYRGDTFVTTRNANLFRQDLVNAGKGNGVHGFTYAPNSSFKDGVWRTAGVRFPTGGHLNYLVASDLQCDAMLFPGLTPAQNLSTGGVTYTVGTQFSAARSGQITEIGFYRALNETGSNILKLWTDSGTLLATATTNCSANNWCWADISDVNITASSLYRVTATTNTFQSKTNCGIGSGIDNGLLDAYQGFWIAGNAFPTTGSCSNYFVDVKYSTQ
jgi:PKD repeat protein